MERTQQSEETLTVTELSGGGDGEYIAWDDGTYEAEYGGLKVFMDNTPWGEKKAARLYFICTRGKYKGQKTTFKGLFFQDKETGAWVVGSKSKLADVIRAISGGKTLSEDSKGLKVFVVIKSRVSKKNGKTYSNVESVIPRPADDDEGVAKSAEETARPAARPAVRAAVPVQAVRQAVKPSIPVAPAASGGLLDDLTELSDFQD